MQHFDVVDLGAFNKTLLESSSRVEVLTQKSSQEKRKSQLLDEAIFELQSEMEELRVAYEELRVQNESLISAATRLEAERLRYKSLFDSTDELYLTTDVHGKINTANAAAVDALKIRNDFLENKIITGFIPVESRKAFRAALNRLKNGEPHLETVVCLKPRKSADTQCFNAEATLLRTGNELSVEIRWRLKPLVSTGAAGNVGPALGRGALLRNVIADEELVSRELFEKFFQVYDEISSAETANLVMEQLASGAANLVGDIAYLSLLTPDQKRLVPAAAASHDGSFEALVSTYKAAKSHVVRGNVVEKALLSNQAFVISSNQHENNNEDASVKKGSLNMLVIPIRLGNNALGALTLIREKHKPGYTKTDVRLVQALADHAGTLLGHFSEVSLQNEKFADSSFSLAMLAALCRNIQGPLHAILGYSGYLGENVAELSLEETVDDLAKISKAATFLTDFVGEIFEYSRLEQGQVSPTTERISILNLVSDLETEVRYGLGLQTFKIHTDGDLKYLHVELDSGWTRQMLVKLIRTVYQISEDFYVECAHDDENVWLSLHCTGSSIAESASRIKEAGNAEKAKLTQDGVNSDISLRLMLAKRICRHIPGNFDVELTGAGTTVIKLGFSLTR